jgi:hypothetical protein
VPDIHLALPQLPFPAVASALGLDVAKYQRKGEDWAGPCPVHQGDNRKSPVVQFTARSHRLAGCPRAFVPAKLTISFPVTELQNIRRTMILSGLTP